jgi:2'-5' RNA ligase
VSETAVVVLFPELESLIGELRRRHTHDGAHEMPPHVTLIYPFADSSEVGSHLETLERELGSFAPFEVAFGKLARFPEVLYVQPEPPKPFVEMTEALTGAFPEFPPYGGAFHEVVPHVTVAQGEEALLDRIEAALQVEAAARVERVWLVEDTAEGWRRHTAFPLVRHTRA